MFINNRLPYLLARTILILFVFSMLFISLAGCYSNESQVYRIGVLSVNGDKVDLQDTWVPVTDYLSDNVPDSLFETVPLSYDEFSQTVATNSIDFFYCNPLLYVEMAHVHGAERISTFQPVWNHSSYAKMGGVIFTSADRNDINSLQDLKGRSFLAVSESSLGGYLAAANEFHLNDIENDDFGEVAFSNSHEKVVLAVVEGNVDAGTVRTGILEQMIREGIIDPDDIKILNKKDYAGYPLFVSTGLYPDWAFAKMVSTSDEVSKNVAIALLSMPADSDAAIALGSGDWTVPADYYLVDELMRELKYGMYLDYGKVTFKEAFIQHCHLLMIIILGLVLFGVYSCWMLDKKKKSQLEASNRLKDLFTDIMRHDLLNPATVVQGVSEMLYSEEEDPEKKASLKLINDQTEHLMSMIASAAKLAKLESYEDMDFSVQDIGFVILIVADSFASEFEQKKIKSDITINGNYPSRVNDVIEDVFSNLISNALKYSPEGSTIRMDIVDLGRSFKVMITDEGEGIPDDVKPLVFDRFKRADKKGIKGTGLGLAIVKRIVDIHNGNVGVEDNPAGKGSVFWVELEKAKIDKN